MVRNKVVPASAHREFYKLIYDSLSRRPSLPGFCCTGRLGHAAVAPRYLYRPKSGVSVFYLYATDDNKDLWHANDDWNSGWSHILCSMQRWGFVRSTKRCRHCILGLYYSAYLRQEFQNLTCNPPPPSCGLYSIHCTFYNALTSGTPEPEFLKMFWRLKSLFKGQRVQQGSYRLQFFLW